MLPTGTLHQIDQKREVREGGGGGRGQILEEECEVDDQFWLQFI